jgi:BirA family transcriptional regulator, biotin operon repressor / biotin---[acetyl-CoA-carboxylase] ligase
MVKFSLFNEPEYFHRTIFLSFFNIYYDFFAISLGEVMANYNPDNNSTNTLFVGNYYLYLSQSDSTNIALKNLLSTADLQEGAVISAGYQLSGRGQAGTTWQSERDQNILLSVLLFPRFLKAQKQFNLSQAISLAVHDFIKNLIPDTHVQIKWPNDIYAAGEKISGILIENTLKGETIENSIIGIGININEVQLEQNRTSLKSFTGLDYDLRYLEKILFSNIEARYLQLKANSDVISRDYQANLFGFETNMHFTDLKVNETFDGMIIGINPDGRLLIESEDGLKLYGMKEVKFGK